jgi:hypothetical protein
MAGWIQILAAMIALGTGWVIIGAGWCATSPSLRRAALPLPLGQALAAAIAPAEAPAEDDTKRITIDGRILDLEGRPVTGATVTVKYVQAPSDQTFDAWIDEVKRIGKQPFGLPYVGMPRRGPISGTTDRDGHFKVADMPRDSIATVVIKGPGIETSQVYVLTRDMPPLRAKDRQLISLPTIIYYGARFDHVAAPARPIAGTIRDKDTGAPISGVHITGMPNIPSSTITTPDVEATTDAQGRYRIEGLPTTRGFKLFTEAPANQPYVNCGFISPASNPEPGPLTFDMTLKRGVLVRGRLTDKVTGKPLHGFVNYFAFVDNPHLIDYPNFKRESHVTRAPISDADGHFTIPALPGRGLLAVRAPEVGYLHGIGAPGIKGLDANLGVFLTSPHYCSIADQHIFAEVNPAPGTNEIAVELQADPGRSISGTIIDPDGQPIATPVEIRTLDVFQSSRRTSNNSSAFAMHGLPSGPYRLDFVAHERKLAGSLLLTGREAGKLTVRLQRWGAVTGRVVDDQGKPRADVEIFSAVRPQPDPERGDLETKLTVDGHGRFRIDGLVPGVKYDALGNSPNKASGPVLNGVVVQPGEVKDLGDVVLPVFKPGGA